MSETREILNKLDKVENRVIALEVEFKLIKKLIYGALAGIGGIFGIGLI